MTDHTPAPAHEAVLTDDQIEALAKKHIAPHADRLDAIMANPVPYQQTEQFRRVKALIVDVLSKLRKEAGKTKKGDSSLGAYIILLTKRRLSKSEWERLVDEARILRDEDPQIIFEHDLPHRRDWWGGNGKWTDNC